MLGIGVQSLNGGEVADAADGGTPIQASAHTAGPAKFWFVQFTFQVVFGDTLHREDFCRILFFAPLPLQD